MRWVGDVVAVRYDRGQSTVRVTLAGAFDTRVFEVEVKSTVAGAYEIGRRVQITVRPVEPRIRRIS